MLIIKVEKEKSIEIALKKYKNKVQKTKQIQQLRSRQEFVKPSIIRRTEVNKAKYVQKLKDGLND
jgi:small subunit ribosomal protein S21